MRSMAFPFSVMAEFAREGERPQSLEVWQMDASPPVIASGAKQSPSVGTPRLLRCARNDRRVRPRNDLVIAQFQRAGAADPQASASSNQNLATTPAAPSRCNG